MLQCSMITNGGSFSFRSSMYVEYHNAADYKGPNIVSRHVFDEFKGCTENKTHCIDAPVV
ncbi:MAG: hypothetical protein ACI8XX_000995 [Polaribacter sp.]|jgi:hypothetical protein